MKVIKVDAMNTSKECSNCGSIQDMPLSVREYNCVRCGMRLDRDINASINILKRATLGQWGSKAQGGGVRPQQGQSSKNLEHTLQTRGKPTTFSHWSMSRL